MSVCVYPLPKDQQVRLGARTALAALAPFPRPRLWSAPWNLNRQPLAWARTTYHGWRPDLELPEDMPPELAAELTAGRAAAARGAAPGCPESISYAWGVDHSVATPGGGAHATSTPAIPWPFIITGFFFNRATTGGVAHEYVLQLFSTDQAYSEIALDSPETRLIPNMSPGLATDRSFGMGFTSAAGNAAESGRAIATAVVGTLVPEAGKRVTIAILDLGAPEAITSGVITVQRCVGAQAFSEAAFRPTTIRLTAPRPPPPAPEPIAAPPVVTAPPAPVQMYAATENRLIAVSSGGQPLEFWRSRGYMQPVAITQPPSLELRQVCTPDQAYQLAQQFDAAGRHAQAAVYRDMYNRMIRRLALTTEQRALLAPGCYSPAVTAIYASPTIGAPMVRIG